VAEHGCDVLMSFADVPWAHVVALAVARRCGRPWVACFTDPWSNHPLARISRPRRAVERALERRTLARADRLVFTNTGLRDWVIGPHAERDGAGRKSAVIPYFFDPALYPAARARSGDGLLIRHMGNTAPGRYTPAFFEALSRIKCERPDLWARLTLEFYGTLRSAHRDEARRLGLEDRVRFLPAVPYRESLGLMREADVLLLLTMTPADLAGLGQATLFLKMVDYVGAGRPIFAPAGEGSPTHEALAESGGVCPSDDPAVIQETLIRFLAAPRAPSQEIRLGFSKERVAPCWTRLLDAVVADGGPRS